MKRKQNKKQIKCWSEILEYKKSDEADGTIIEQSPKAEVLVASLDRIKVIVSGTEKGELIKIDDYTEREFSVVEAEIIKLGLNVNEELAGPIEEQEIVKTPVSFVISVMQYVDVNGNTCVLEACVVFNILNGERLIINFFLFLFFCAIFFRDGSAAAHRTHQSQSDHGG